MMRKFGVYEKRQDEYLKYFKPYIRREDIVVDLGCGPDAFSKALTGEGRLVVALDIQERLLREIEDVGLERILGDAHVLPFRENSVDCILSLSLMEHLQKPSKHLEELRRVLKTGGRAIIQLPNLQYLFEPHSKWPLLCFMPEGLQSKVFKAINYPYVNMKVTIKYALTLLYETGFRIHRVMKVYHVGIMKLLPMPPSYIFIAVKAC